MLKCATTTRRRKRPGCAHPPEEERRLYASGGNGKRYPVRVCMQCGRLAFDHVDLDSFAKAFARSRPAWRLPASLFLKAIASGCYKDPASCNLRWITLHPNGDDTTGVPALVHDNGEEYTIVGGAGGRLNQQVLRRPADADDGDKAARKKAQKEKRIARQKARVEALGPQVEEMRVKAAALKAEVKKQTEELTNRVLEALHGGQLRGNVLETIAAEATKRAISEHADATPEEQKEFADKAQSEAVQEAKEQARRVVHEALDHAAVRALGDDDSSPAEFQAKLDGKTVVRKFTTDELDKFVQASADIAETRAKARAIERALRAGDQETLQGIQAACRSISPEEAKAQNLDRYLNETDVDANVSLVKGSEAASTVTQRRNQANGASDGLNNFVAAATGSAILRPEVVRKLGVENAARVAAAYLTDADNVDAAQTAEKLRDRIQNSSTASIAAVLERCDQMDAITENVKQAGAASDGSITKAQVSIVAANMAATKFRLLNTTRGQLRAAAALAHFLEHPTDRGIAFAGGDTAVAAHATAAGLGLGKGDYTLEKAKGGGYEIQVDKDHLTALAKPHSLAESERNVAMDELRQDVEQNPGQWTPQGWNTAGYEEAPGKTVQYRLQAHHELAARAIVRNKRMVLNYGAGSGKTSIAYAAAGELLGSGACDRGLITMPAKPRAQQVTGKGKGEAYKFLAPEMADRVAVVQDGQDLKKQLKAVADGTKSVLICSPQLMRDHADELLGAGFGGPKSFYFADEAHEFAIGHGEGQGSGMAQAARKFAKADYFAAMSGTLIENNASELHSVYDLAHPGELGSQRQFAEEWKRMAQGSKDLFADEAIGRMRDRLAGGMLSYHKAVTRKGESGADEPLKLERNVLTVKATAAQKAAVAEANRQYKLDRQSPDERVAKSAALTREARIKRILTSGVKDKDGALVNPKLEAAAQIMRDEKARNPQNRVGVYAFEKAPLRAAGKALGGKMVSITGEDDDRATEASVRAINDRTNDTDGVLLSNAANYGVNLQGMDHLIKLHPLDVPSKEDQLDHRHFRTGQTRDVRATTILTDHPAEQLAQFRTSQVTWPEVAVLAALADDSHASSQLGGHYDTIKEAAGGKA